jgi:2-keto-4-pentenoate hydratase
MDASHPPEAIAIAFTEARRNARPLAAFPGVVPASLAHAYAVQDAAIARWPDRIAGWKVAGVAPEFRDRLGASRIAGPAFAASVFRLTGPHRPSFPVFSGGFAAVEAEFIFRLGADLEPGDAADMDRLADAVAAMHAGAEIASSPFAGINELGPASVVCDFGNNNGLILGPEIAGWRQAALESLTSRTLVNGVVAGEGSAARVAGGPLAALAFLVASLGARGRALSAGDLVSTGMTTGIHPVVAGDVVRFEFPGAIVFEGTARPADPAA